MECQSRLSLQNGGKTAREDIINSLGLIATENSFQKRDFAHKEPRGMIQQWKHPSSKERVFRKSLFPTPSIILSDTAVLIHLPPLSMNPKTKCRSAPWGELPTKLLWGLMRTMGISPMSRLRNIKCNSHTNAQQWVVFKYELFPNSSAQGTFFFLSSKLKF